MKITIKILLTIFAFCLFTFAFMPEMIMGTPASPAVGNWYQQFLPNIGSRSITDIFFLDSLTGLAVTNKSTTDTMFVLKTSNAGNNWSIHFRKVQTGGGTPGYNRVYFLNQNTGYACYTLGFDKTIDGGANWASLRTGESFQDMSVLNNDTIWIVSANPLTGGVFFTSTGGANWVQQYSAGSQNPEKIYMYNARIGFISDNSGSSSIRKTTNGGLNWNINVPGEWFTDIHFVDSLIGWRCMPSFDTATWVKKTTDGGITWIKQILPTGGIILTSQIYNLAIINKDTLWGSGGQAFYGGGRFRGILYKTINGGDTWKFQIPDTGFQIQGYGKIQFINKFTGWANSNLENIHTTNGGDTTFFVGLELISTEVPRSFMLYQNYPNPFNPKTNIKYQITKNNSNVQLTVYDIQGRKITELVNQKQNSGSYEVDFSGIGYSSGVYFYKLIVSAGKEVFTETKKMTLIK